MRIITFFYSCTAEKKLLEQLEGEIESVTKLLELQTAFNLETEKKEREVLESARNATNPEIKAKYLQSANGLRKVINSMSDDIEKSTKQLEQLKRAKTDAEAKLKECLEKNPQ